MITSTDVRDPRVLGGRARQRRPVLRPDVRPGGASCRRRPVRSPSTRSRAASSVSWSRSCSRARSSGASRWVGLAHLFVFWGFVAFGGYTLVETLHGLGLVDLTRHDRVPRLHATCWCRSAVAVLAGIVFLRHPSRHRAAARPRAPPCRRNRSSSPASSPSLMITFLLDLFVLDGGIAARVNWWVHMLVIFTFLVLIPDSKHLHLLLSPAHRVPQGPRARHRAQPRLREGGGRDARR